MEYISFSSSDIPESVHVVPIRISGIDGYSNKEANEPRVPID